MTFLDNTPIGPWEKQVVDPLRGSFATWTLFVSLRAGKPVPVGQEMMILAVEDYDPGRDTEFWKAVTQRIRIRVEYESLYGTEQYEAWFEGSYAHSAESFAPDDDAISNT